MLAAEGVLMGSITQFLKDALNRAVCTGCEFKPEQGEVHFVFSDDRDDVRLHQDTIAGLLETKKRDGLVEISKGAFVPRSQLQIAYTKLLEQGSTLSPKSQIDALFKVAPLSY